MSENLIIEENVCLTGLTRDINEFQCSKLKQILESKYSSKDKFERKLGTILNSIFSNKRYYFAISRKVMTALLEEDPNLKVNTISGSDYKKIIEKYLKTKFKMKIGFSKDNKTPSVWTFKDSELEVLFNELYPEINKEIQLEESKAFVDPNTRTYTTVDQTSIEREKQIDIEHVLKTMQGPQYITIDGKKVCVTDIYNGYINQYSYFCSPDEFITVTNRKTLFCYEGYIFIKGYNFDYEYFNLIGKNLRARYIVDVSLDTHPGCWKKALYSITMHFIYNVSEHGGWLKDDLKKHVETRVISKILDQEKDINRDHVLAHKMMYDYIFLILEDYVEEYNYSSSYRGMYEDWITYFIN